MRPVRVLLLLLLALGAAPGARAEEREITVHPGTRADGTMYFDPSDVTVDVGDRVTLHLVNDDPLPHDIVIDGLALLDVEIEVEARESGSKTFTAGKPGNFTMFCEIGDHASRGMTGTFRVLGERDAPAPAWLAVGAVAAAALAAARRR